MAKEVCYIWDENLIAHCDHLPAILNRASMVHSLITSYNLFDHIKVVRSNSASERELKEFHTASYINHLKNFQEIDEDYMSSDQDEEYGIGYDCPPVSQLYEIVSTLAGGSITAAKCLMLGMTNVVINWCGGWHHAQRSNAEGFCYVNDIVIAIGKLQRKFQKILYIDLDVHHGNGVQNAYRTSKSVFTLSFHKFEVGFYPGSGGIDDVGSSEGEGYSCNFPFHSLYSDETFTYAFDKIFSSVFSYFSPDAIVVQCGADALAHDPNGGAQLTIRGYCTCLQLVLDKRKPTILLGGGGYNHPNTARLWASLTALAAGVTLDDNIPEHRFWPRYGPDYTLNIKPALSKDTNKRDYIDSCITAIERNLQKYLASEEQGCNKTKINKEWENSENNKKVYENVNKNKLRTENARTTIYSGINKFTKPESDDVYTFTD